jgi:hypothetical protein
LAVVGLRRHLGEAGTEFDTLPKPLPAWRVWQAERCRPAYRPQSSLSPSVRLEIVTPAGVSGLAILGCELRRRHAVGMRNTQKCYGSRLFRTQSRWWRE